MPAPLAMPPIVQPSGEVWMASLVTVSVVRIASAADGPPAWARSWAASSMPVRTASIGSRTPIRPVEQTATSSVAHPTSAAVHSAICRASASPADPVQAFAPPEFSTTGGEPAVGDGLPASRLHRCCGEPVGGEHAGRVRVRALVDDQREVGPAGGLQAGDDAGGEETLCCGDTHGATPIVVRPRSSAKAEGEVHGLDGTAGGALGEVVERGHRDQPAGRRVHGDLHVDGVGARRSTGSAARVPRAGR